jgi:putative PLP-dependent aminotransferase (TIGR04422 family)|tara:strand:+ start:53 stop:1006 length:954 start_codon:yes stop_codon:yes gene_type:complete
MNQWPTPVKYNFIKKNNIFSKKKLNEIEIFFSNRYNSKYAFLCPSSRSSLNLILKYLKFNRTKTVSIPKWSSNCLYQSMGPISNISVEDNSSDALLVVHKWGHTYKVNNRSNKVWIIEDSADCLPNKKFRPFENKSEFEVISLPKIIGSYSGGIVLTNNKKFYMHGKRKQLRNKNLGARLSKMKYEYWLSKNKNKNKNDWFYKEHLNTSFDGNVIDNIFNCLKYYEKNLLIIKKRQKLLKEVIPRLNFDIKRLGPCAVFKEKKYPYLKNILELKHFNFSKKANKGKYEKCFILPIHFRITDNLFNDKLKKIISKKKK